MNVKLRVYDPYYSYLDRQVKKGTVLLTELRTKLMQRQGLPGYWADAVMQKWLRRVRRTR